MSDLEAEKFEQYKKMAEEHADFLCEYVFKPAFKMAFLHGAKHMHDELQPNTKPPKFDNKQWVINVVVEDINNNGTLRQRILELI